MRVEFDPRLRLILVTDGRGDLGRIEDVAASAVAGGCRCVQLREPDWSARRFEEACARLRPALERAGGVLLVNDRVDLACAGAAHGAQVGHRSLTPGAAREALGARGLLGYSVHDARELEEAAAAGCDFALLAPIWQTDSKPGVTPLGVAAAGELTATAALPVVWLGGVSVAHSAQLRGLPAAGRPSGLAAMGALMAAKDPAAVATALLAELDGCALDPAGRGDDAAGP